MAPAAATEPAPVGGGAVPVVSPAPPTAPTAAAPVAITASGSPNPRDDALRRAFRMLLERAKQRYEAGRAAGATPAARGHFEAALDALHLAYQLAPAPWLLFNMAQVQSQIGACSEAADLYHRFIASSPAPAARSSAEQALQLLGTCEDGGLAPAPDESLTPGLLLAPALSSRFEFEHEPAPVAPAAPALQAESPARATAILPWAFGGLAVMSGVASAIYWHEANSAKSDLDRIQVAGPEVTRTQERGESALDLARLFGGVAVGFSLAAVGSYWWLEHERARETPLTTALRRLSITPLEGGAAAGYQSEF